MTELSDVDLAARVRRVVVAPDGDEYVLGRPDLALYVVVPPPGGAFVQALQEGLPLPAATARASAVAGTTVDGTDFLAGLEAAGLLEPAGASRPGSGARTAGPARSREIRWIEGVSQATARRLFGPAMWTGYGLAALFVAVVLLVRADLRPTFEHYWWLPDPVLSVLTVAVIVILVGAVHELWHWLAARAIGVPAIFRMSYRGIYLVFETDVTQIVTTARRNRYGVFLAGMAFDVTLLAVVLALRLGYRADLLPLPGWLDRLLGSVVLLQVISIGWQWAALLMRSDGYAVLANALRCHDLYRATWLTTKQRVWRLTEAETTELASMSAHDRRVARGFWLAYLAGLVVMAWLMLAFAIPFLISMMWWVGHNLLHPAPATLAFWESVLVLALVAGQYSLVGLLAARERRLRRTGALR